MTLVPTTTHSAASVPPTQPVLWADLAISWLVHTSAGGAVRKQCKARIDPSQKATGESELPPVSCHFLPFPAARHFSAAGKSSKVLILGLIAALQPARMGPWLHWIHAKGTRAREFLQEKTRRRIFTHTEQSFVWGRVVCLACPSRLSVRGKRRAKQRRQQCPRCPWCEVEPPWGPRCEDSAILLAGDGWRPHIVV